jgi:hypothetical protein
LAMVGGEAQPPRLSRPASPRISELWGGAGRPLRGRRSKLPRKGATSKNMARAALGAVAHGPGKCLCNPWPRRGSFGRRPDDPESGYPNPFLISSSPPFLRASAPLREPIPDAGTPPSAALAPRPNAEPSHALFQELNDITKAPHPHKGDPCIPR